MQAFLVNAGCATLLLPPASLLPTKKATPVQSVSVHAWCVTLLCSKNFLKLFVILFTWLDESAYG